MDTYMSDQGLEVLVRVLISRVLNLGQWSRCEMLVSGEIYWGTGSTTYTKPRRNVLLIEIL